MLQFIVALSEGIVLMFGGLHSVWQLQNMAYSPRDYLKVSPKYYAMCLLAGVVAFAAWQLKIEATWLEFCLAIAFFLMSVTLTHTPALVYTSRVKRQLVANLTVLTAASFFLPLWAVIIPLHILMFFGYYIMLPWEKLNNNRYLRRSGDMLKSAGYLKVAVVGSYAKTTVKTFLAAILSEKFRAVATPGSVNTPLGIAALVNRGKFEDAEVAVLEFGARRKGDIAFLTNMVAPDLAVITGISPQHLRTFKTTENIILTKTEILRALPPDKKAVINGLDKTAAAFGGIGGCRKVFCGREGDRVYARNVELSSRGASFELVFDGGAAECQTSLLGRHNVTNVCLAAAAAFELGLTPKEIQNGVKNLKPAPHRLEIIKTQNGTVIDDSYNGNSEGIAAAAEVLKLFDGKKFVVTQGIIEGGRRQRELNVSAGRILGGVADKAVVVGKNSGYLVEGLMLGGMEKDDILFAPNVTEAVEALSGVTKDSVILFQNDLPK